MVDGESPQDRIVDALIRTGPFGDGSNLAATACRWPSCGRIRTASTSARSSPASRASSTRRPARSSSPPADHRRRSTPARGAAGRGRPDADQPPGLALGQQLDAQRQRPDEGQGALHASDSSRRRRRAWPGDGRVAEVDSRRRPHRSTRRGDRRDADRCGVPSVGLGSRCARSAHAPSPKADQASTPTSSPTRAALDPVSGNGVLNGIPVTVGRPA